MASPNRYSRSTFSSCFTELPEPAWQHLVDTGDLADAQATRFRAHRDQLGELEAMVRTLGFLGRGAAAEGVFNSYSMLIDDAEQDHGITPSMAYQIEEKLSAGSLERICQHSVMTGRHYWLSLRQGSDANFKAKQLADW